MCEHRELSKILESAEISHDHALGFLQSRGKPYAEFDLPNSLIAPRSVPSGLTENNYGRSLFYRDNKSGIVMR